MPSKETMRVCYHSVSATSKRNRVDFSLLIVNSDTEFDNAVLDGANLSGITLEDGQFRGASFKAANLSGGTFRSGDFYDADFSMANLAQADFSNSAFYNAEFNMANLNNTNLTEADLRRARNMASASNISTAIWGETRCPDNTYSDDAESGGCYPDHLEPPTDE